jgi:hypothetical protein
MHSFVCHSNGYDFEETSTIVGLQDVEVHRAKNLFQVSTFLSNVMAIFRSMIIQIIKYFKITEIIKDIRV